MSRAKATDVSSPISLFPFIGVLLSTMGALLVVLIAVSRSAHDAAVRELDAKKVAAAAEGQETSRQRLQEVNEHLARLAAVRTEAEQRLRDDQLRLSHIEDHTRRLQEQLKALRTSVENLVKLEHTHYDDRTQAEREVERLNQLIAMTRDAIAAARDEKKSKKRSYSIIPYDGPNGTRRRPIYIECRKNEVVLQPEDIHLTAEDFRPPLGAGNPLAAALRAAREYIVQQEGASATDREAQPYPLILVRPEGILAYYRVRQAIESWDTDFGYELIDNDWKLEFPTSNPLLAELELRAVEQSRTRQQMLVAAAPRAYGARHAAGGGGFDDDELVDEGDGETGDEGQSGGGFGNGGRYNNGGGGYGNGSGGPYATNAAPNGEQGEFFAKGVPTAGAGDGAAPGSGDGRSGGYTGTWLVGVPGGGSSGDGLGGGAGGPAAGGSPTPTGGTGSGGGSGGAAMPPGAGQQPGSSLNVAAGAPTGSGGDSRGAPPPLSSSAIGSSLAGGIGEANLSAAERSVARGLNSGGPGSDSKMTNDTPPERMPLDMQLNKHERMPSSARGQNWAIKGKGPASVPVRRTIRVAVHADRLALLPDSPQSAATAGNDIPMAGSTAANLDEFVRAVQGRVHDWGLAGASMYWRPVLLLEVAPDGQARANDLAQLLKNSGIEVRDSATATRPQEGASNATR